jgi:hypothetical protein
MLHHGYRHDIIQEVESHISEGKVRKYSYKFRSKPFKTVSTECPEVYKTENKFFKTGF